MNIIQIISRKAFIHTLIFAIISALLLYLFDNKWLLWLLIIYVFNTDCEATIRHGWWHDQHIKDIEELKQQTGRNHHESADDGTNVNPHYKDCERL